MRCLTCGNRRMVNYHRGSVGCYDCKSIVSREHTEMVEFRYGKNSWVRVPVGWLLVGRLKQAVRLEPRPELWRV